MKTTQTLGLAVVTSVALGLSACGGGQAGGDAVSPSNAPAAADTVPASALSSTASFVDYQQQLSPSDTVEPLTLQQQLPPLSDTTEPMPMR